MKGFFAACLAALLVASGFAIHRAGELSDGRIRAELVERTRMIASLLSPEEAELVAAARDEAHPAFRTLREKFTRLADGEPDIRYIYLVERIADGALVFRMDSQPARHAASGKPLARPGEIYDDAPPEFHRALSDGRPCAFGPYSDKWGEFVSALCPVAAPAPAPRFLFGMDITTGECARERWRARAAAGAVALLVLVLFLLYASLHLRRAAAAEEAERRARFSRALLDLLRRPAEGLQDALDALALALARETGVARAGIWRLDETRGDLVCLALAREGAIDPEARGAALRAADYPEYFAALAKEGVLHAPDARTHPATAPFLEPYLLPFGIHSMLDAPVWSGGRPAGTVCLEATGAPRTFSPPEIELVQGAADLAALAFEAEERRHAETRLKSARDYLEQLIDRIADPIFVKDAFGRFVLVNESFCAFTGRTRDALVGATDADFFPPEQVAVFRDRDRAVLETGEEDVNEEQLTDAAGRTKTIVTRKSRYIDDVGGRFVVGVIRDITERKRGEAESLRASKLESLGLLAGGIAHDFNNLLTAIVGNLGLARRLASPEGRLPEVLGRIERSAERGRELTQQLITFARGGAPVLRPACLGETVRAAAEFVCAGAPARLEISVAADLPVCAFDEGQIHRVVTNLVLNAVQASPPGGRVTVEVGRIAADAPAPHELSGRDLVRATVRDEGPGFPPADLPRIFDPYFTTKAGGSGLGLTTAYSIARRHGGALVAENGPTGGARVHLYLPVAPAAFRAAPQPGSGGTAGDPSHLARPRRLLLMDDEEAVLDPLAEMLVASGYLVEKARDGAEAVERYRELHAAGTPPDLVVTDLVVARGMGGREASEQIRALEPAARIIVSSGYSSDPILADPERYGFVAAIPKPYRFEELLDLIGRMLRDPR